MLLLTYTKPNTLTRKELINNLEAKGYTDRYINRVLDIGSWMLDHEWKIIETVKVSKGKCSFCGKEHLTYEVVLENEDGIRANIGRICAQNIFGDSDLFAEIKKNISLLERKDNLLKSRKKRFFAREFNENAALGIITTKFARPKKTLLIAHSKRDTYAVMFNGKTVDTYCGRPIDNIQTAKEIAFDMYCAE